MLLTIYNFNLMENDIDFRNENEEIQATLNEIDDIIEKLMKKKLNKKIN